MSGLASLQGRQLTAVTTLHDYFQLAWDDLVLSVYSPCSVLTAGNAVPALGPVGPSLLSTAIGRRIASIVETPDGATITFDGGIAVNIDLADESRTTPEAMHLHGPNISIVW